MMRPGRRNPPAVGHPCRESQDRRGRSLIGWGGGLIALYGTAHTVGAFVAEGAARHVGTWFSGALRGADLSAMSPEMSAYWLSVNSFGPSFVVIGSAVLWMNRHGIIPPRFIAYCVAGWAVLDMVIAGLGVGQNLILITGCVLLLAGTRRAQPVVVSQAG